jgi:hypothetical protein
MGRVGNSNRDRLIASLKTTISIAQAPRDSPVLMQEGLTKKDTTSLEYLLQTLVQTMANTVADQRDITSIPRRRPCLYLEVLPLYQRGGSFSRSGRSFEKMKVGLRRH